MVPNACLGYEAENDYESTYVGLVKKVDAGEIQSLAEPKLQEW